MTPTELANMRKIVVEGWPREDFTPTLFDVWTGALIEFEFADVEQAIKHAIATERFRPEVAGILENLYSGPSAGEIASTAWQAIGRYGYHSEERARAALPDVTWQAIEYFGGWMSWCMSDDAPATRERMAKIADRLVKRAAREGHVYRPEIEAPKPVEWPMIGMRVE